MKYYVYQYLRKDGTPYYVGKGIRTRAFESHKRDNGTDLLPHDKSQIQIVKENLTELEAYQLEKELIARYGRKDIGTGILRNMSDGGEGAPGRIYRHSIEAKQKISAALKGKSKKPFTDEHKKNMSKSALVRPDRIFSESHKQNMRKPKIKVVCPHCNKEGGANTMKRYHFGMCKELIKN